MPGSRGLSTVRADPRTVGTDDPGAKEIVLAKAFPVGVVREYGTPNAGNLDRYARSLAEGVVELNTSASLHASEVTTETRAVSGQPAVLLHFRQIGHEPRNNYWYAAVVTVSQGQPAAVVAQTSTDAELGDLDRILETVCAAG